MLRIPGANCQHVLAEALATLFRHAGLPTRFFWGPEFWGSTFTEPPRKEEEGEGEREAGSGFEDFKKSF